MPGPKSPKGRKPAQKAAPEPEPPPPEPVANEPPQPETTADKYAHYYSLSHDPVAATKFLASMLELPDIETDARSAARLDFTAYALQFAREASFGPLRMEALMAIASSILEATIAGASCSVVQATFQARLLAATSPKPGDDSDRFSPDQVAQVAQYFARTFFRHFRLYSYLYNSPQDLSESTVTLLVETAVVPPFDAALSEADYLQALQDKEDAEAAAAEEARLAREAEEEAAAVRAAAEEAVRAEEERQAELQRKPATLEDAIQHMVAVRMEAEKELLQATYDAKEKALLQRLGEVEANRAPEKPHAGDKTTRRKTPPEKPKSPISSSPSPPRPRVPAA